MPKAPKALGQEYDIEEAERRLKFFKGRSFERRLFDTIVLDQVQNGDVDACSGMLLSLRYWGLSLHGELVDPETHDEIIRECFPDTVLVPRGYLEAISIAVDAYVNGDSDLHLEDAFELAGGGDNKGVRGKKNRLKQFAETQRQIEQAYQVLAHKFVAERFDKKAISTAEASWRAIDFLQKNGVEDGSSATLVKYYKKWGGI